MLRCIALLILLAGPAAAALNQSAFFIRVVDEATGRGVPLITVKATNHLSWITDSAGVAAVIEPGLMGQQVFLHVSGPGYEYPADGFGYRGVRLDFRPGGWGHVKVKRTNIAERLYRVTGEGIYRDSVLAGEKTPLAEPLLNAQVVGQDSVQTCLYRGKLYWFWGDTAKPSYPLGHFAMAGAVSDLPSGGGLDPAVGVDLRYFVDSSGFSRKMAPMDEPGMIWLDGVFAVDDDAGKRRMIAKHARMKSLGEASERGFMVYDDEKEQFVPLVRSGPEFLLFNDSGHPFGVQTGDERYYYFPTPFNLAVRMRVKASWQNAIDPDAYEILTALPTKTGSQKEFRWVSSAALLKESGLSRTRLIEAIRKEKDANCRLLDIQTGKPLSPQSGSVYWNEYRGKWVMVAVQWGGEASFLGEVWYAEADTPVGPWGYARRIATHPSYSFYNPKQHPHFSQDGGRLIYFEGTYVVMFSGREEDAAPRYDYNQLMYRLDLADERLFLPQPVYEVGTDGPAHYGMGPEFGQAGEPAFYAMSPGRSTKGLIAVYQTRTPDGGLRLTAAAAAGAKPLFMAMAPTDDAGEMTADLYEYTNRKTAAVRYRMERPQGDGWVRSEKPLCRVWRVPPVAQVADWDAHPWTN